jgi:hypothetical protein
MCHTRAGESGSWFGIAPNEAKVIGDGVGHQAADRDDRSLTGALDTERVAR